MIAAIRNKQDDAGDVCACSKSFRCHADRFGEFGTAQTGAMWADVFQDQTEKAKVRRHWAGNGRLACEGSDANLIAVHQ